MIDSTYPSHSSNEDYSHPISKKNNPGVIAVVGNRALEESSELQSNSSRSEINGQLKPKDKQTEKIQEQFSQNINEDKFREDSAKNSIPSKVNDYFPNEEDDFGQKTDLSSDEDVKKEETSEINEETSEINEEISEIKQTEMIKRKAVEQLKGVSSGLERTKQNLRNHAIVIDHEISVGDTKYTFLKSVDLNDKTFKKRLAQEKSQFDFSKYASAKDIKVDAENVKEFCSDIGRLREDGTALFPSKILSNLKDAKVILLDDLTEEERNQIDKLIIENRLPPNIRIRNVALMDKDDHEFIQQMVADYFTLSLQEQYLMIQIRLNAQQSNSQKSHPSDILADKTQTNSSAPLFQKTRTAAAQRESKQKKAEKIKDENRISKETNPPEKQRKNIRKSGEEIGQKIHQTLVTNIEQKWEQYKLGQFFNNQEDCLKFYLQFVEESKAIKEVNKKLITLNYTLKEEFRLNSEEFDLVIKHAEELVSGKKNYKLDKIIRLVLPTFNKTSNRSSDNNKNFFDPIIEEIIIQKLNRVLHIHSLIS